MFNVHNVHFEAATVSQYLPLAEFGLQSKEGVVISVRAEDSFAAFAARALAREGVDEWAPIQERAYVLLKSMIEKRRIQPGQKLLAVQVARAFGISRSPAQHALRALESDKLVQRADGQGYIVAGRRLGSAVDVANLDQFALEAAPQWERIYNDVEQELCTNILFRSVRITEEKLAESYAVSRTVARDVLGRMHSVGLITKDRAGRWVAPPMTADRIRDLYQLRWLIEPAALVQSISKVPAETVLKARDSLRQTLANIESASSAQLDSLEKDLHLTLLDSCDNRELLRALKPTRLLLVSNRYVFDLYIGIPRTEIEDALGSHLKVIESALRGRHKDAARELELHLKQSCEHWQQRFDTIAKTAMQSSLPEYLTIAD